MVTPAYERVAEAAILLSGAGWESCGTAATHVLGTRLADFPQLHGAMHGEKVSLGIVTQLLLDPATDMAAAAELVDFMAGLGLPVAMEDIGLDHVPETELLSCVKSSAAPAGEPRIKIAACPLYGVGTPAGQRWCASNLPAYAVGGRTIKFRR